MTTSLHISTKAKKYKEENKNGVPLCPGMAVIWWSSQESLQWQDEWIPTPKPQKEKNICYPNVPSKKIEEREKKKRGIHQNELFNA